MKTCLYILFLLIPLSLQAHIPYPDIVSTARPADTLASASRPEPLKFNSKALIIPGTLILYGIVETAVPEKIKLLNYGIGHEVKNHVDNRVRFDDITQYVPMASVYALDLLGVGVKNNFRDRTFILGMSAAFMGITVNSLKYTIRKERPDGSERNSFPSGHTAISFMGAEFLWQETKHQSIWYGIGGYMLATGTAFFRMYNDKHWFGDIAAGAGIGILSTKAAYWLYPTVRRWFDSEHRQERKKNAANLSPFYNGSQWGASLALVF